MTDPHTKTLQQNQNRMRLREIRAEMGFSIGTMAEDLGLKKATYQGYETGRRAVPRQVMIAAEKSLENNREYYRTRDDRIDAMIDGET